MDTFSNSRLMCQSKSVCVCACMCFFCFCSMFKKLNRLASVVDHRHGQGFEGNGIFWWFIRGEALTTRWHYNGAKRAECCKSWVVGDSTEPRV